MWQYTPIALALAAILLSWLDCPRGAGICGYGSLAASQLARWRALRRAEMADREMVTTARE